MRSCRLPFLFFMSTSERPPTIDPVAAERWHGIAPTPSPWLHEEVARRMEGRLQWIRQAPAAWCHWDAARGGLQAHALLRLLLNFSDLRHFIEQHLQGWKLQIAL